jgi:DNA-binding response OmpR family regulator
VKQTTSVEPIKVLYIEDDPGAARLIQKKLERAGFRIDLARDGGEGIAKFESENYDVVVLDYSMPGYNGLEVLQIISSRRPLPPTIMITGSGNEKIAIQAMKLGAMDYIIKDVGCAYIDLIPFAVQRAVTQFNTSCEKDDLIEKLQHAKADLAEVISLFPICAYCGKQRTDSDYLDQVKTYLKTHPAKEWGHTACPECAD